jgi:peptidoglycan/xylan/chitin deacetylase (PgdA/CDA1 family)
MGTDKERELELAAELGLHWWRRELLFRLRVRHFGLLIVWANELLERKP